MPSLCPAVLLLCYSCTALCCMMLILITCACCLLPAVLGAACAGVNLILAALVMWKYDALQRSKVMAVPMPPVQVLVLSQA